MCVRYLKGLLIIEVPKKITTVATLMQINKFVTIQIMYSPVAGEWVISLRSAL